MIKEVKDTNGLYSGIVVNNVDPLKKGRIQVRVPQIYGGFNPINSIMDIDLPWALPSLPFANQNSGFFTIPNIGSSVFVMFLYGNPENPIWMGSCYSADSLLPEALSGYVPDPKNYVIKTPLKNLILLSDIPALPMVKIKSPGDVIVENLNTKITSSINIEENCLNYIQNTIVSTSISAKVSITLMSLGTMAISAATLAISTTAAISVAAVGTVTVVSSAITLGITLSALKVLNTNFMLLFNTHTHLYSPGPGGPTPTSPPSIPGVEGSHTTTNTRLS